MTGVRSRDELVEQIVVVEAAPTEVDPGSPHSQMLAGMVTALHWSAGTDGWGAPARFVGLLERARAGDFD